MGNEKYASSFPFFNIHSGNAGKKLKREIIRKIIILKLLGEMREKKLLLCWYACICIMIFEIFG